MKTHAPLLLAISALIFSQAANAQPVEAKTVPVGVVSVTIGGSLDGIAYNQTQIAVPLHETPVISGASSGRITGVGASTVSSVGAGWVNNAFAVVGDPYFIHIKSGAAEGRLLQIMTNTDTSVSLNTAGLDLTTLAITANPNTGDKFEIVQGETLLSLFGTPADGVVGGTTAQFAANQTDRVLANDANGNLLVYYFDTTAAQWRRLGSGANQGNLIVISPKSGVSYLRIGTAALQFQFTGKVPDSISQRQLSRSGSTVVSHYFPIDTALSSLGLQLLPSWRKLGDVGVALNTTDRVVVKTPTGLISYYYDPSTPSWKRVGSGANQNPIIPAGAAVRLIRFGAAGQSETWTQQIPYNL